MSLPAGWVVWTPGAADLPALRANAATTKRAILPFSRGVAAVERQLAKARGDVVQVGVRVPDPAAGLVTGSLFLTHLPRPVGKDGKPLTARQLLENRRAQRQARGRIYHHQELSLVTVPAGRAVLSNELWRKSWGMRDVALLATEIFPRGTDSFFRLELTSSYRELQPTLMAEISHMAHSFTVDRRGPDAGPDAGEEADAEGDDGA
ncbi:hypothetical protein FE374_09195 [Georgenia yuyongxinii]|uniref:Uncharacterized protein n=1 Tax=Georgenia yuyongxinii TaxID=2589797 RepID=A0A5B8C607_9MICO|nr:hypothetical protein [Georgenia yuyongxinii]QDC24765.1 hypothetical protein FE374_09195 [Georgenia yuyongxinii]